MPATLDLKLPSGALRAHRFGAEADRLTLCIHGLSANSRSFDFIAESLASPTSTVVAIDLRGRGWSDITPPGTYGCGLNRASGLMKLLLPNSGDV